jgi:CRISPR-associated protein Cmr4
MKKNPQQLYVLHALSPIHVGEETAMGAVDLPTMRERHTGYPLIPGSSVKGVLREEAEQYFRRVKGQGAEAEEVRAAFGPPSANAGDHRGGLVFTDAHLLALPVRSLCGTFAWVTCARVLERINRDLETAGGDPLPAPRLDDRRQSRVPAPLGDAREGKGAGADSDLLVPPKNDQVFLEELLLTAEPAVEVSTLAQRVGGWLWPDDEAAATFFRRRLLVVHDDVFGFYTRVGLEVRARVKLDADRGTVDAGPWSEEHLPAETLLCGLVVGRATKVKGGGGGRNSAATSGGDNGTPWDAEANLDVLREVTSESPLLRFGGLASVGLGRSRLRLVKPAKGATS